MIRVETIGHGRRAQFAPVSVTWGERRASPWGVFSCTARIPVDALDGPDAPHNGDWWTVRVGGGPALGFGRVLSVNENVQRGGDGRWHARVQLSGDGWLDGWARDDVIVTPGRESDSVGTLFRLREWTRDWWVKTFKLVAGDIGQALADVLPVLTPWELPEALGGGALGARVRVAHDLGSGARAPTRVMDPIRGVNVNALRSFQALQTKARELILGTFVPDSFLIELFPSLEPITSANDSPLAQALGAAPAVVYRFAPWRPEPLGATVALAQDEATVPFIHADGFARRTWIPDPAAERARANRADALGEVFDLDAHGFSGLSWTRSEAARVNAATCGLPTAPQSGWEFVERAGLPLLDEEDVRRHGLRLGRPNWPFFAPPSASTTQQTAQYLLAVAAQMYQFGAGGHRYRSGPVTLRFAPSARAGQLAIGRVGSRRIVAYVDSVTHTVSRDEQRGTWHPSTTLQLIRGAYDEGARRPRSVVVQVPRGEDPSVEQGGDWTGEEQDTGGQLLIGGRYYPIPWKRIRLKLIGGSYVPRFRAPRAVTHAIVHHDATWDARATYRVFAAKAAAGNPASSHFVIDWDGTIFQFADALHTTWHAGIGWINGASIGIDLNNPAKVGAEEVVAASVEAFAKRQPPRPTVEGWQVNGQRLGPLTGYHNEQLLALEALLAALHVHLGIPLAAPGVVSGRENALIWSPEATIRSSPGVWHHAEIDYPRTITDADGSTRHGRTGKWDAAGIYLGQVVGAAALQVTEVKHLVAQGLGITVTPTEVPFDGTAQAVLDDTAQTRPDDPHHAPMPADPMEPQE